METWSSSQTLRAGGHAQEKGHASPSARRTARSIRLETAPAIVPASRRTAGMMVATVTCVRQDARGLGCMTASV
jgi:hypothetical protein|eukprot:COSAG06_NODE_446_length_15654_cov_8.176278_4_plen_74_part_00